jgi:hypothetical protein
MDDITKIQAQVAEVDKRITEKKALLMQLVSDPEMAPYVAALRNGHQPEPEKRPFIPPAGFKNGNGIREAIRKLTLPQRCTNSDIESGLIAANFRSKRELKRSVRDAMFDLSHCDDPFFRVVKVGRGGKPNIYERI